MTLPVGSRDIVLRAELVRRRGERTKVLYVARTYTIDGRAVPLWGAGDAPGGTCLAVLDGIIGAADATAVEIECNGRTVALLLSSIRGFPGN